MLLVISQVLYKTAKCASACCENSYHLERECLCAGHSSQQCKHATNLIIIYSDRKVFVVEQRVSVWHGDDRRICIFFIKLVCKRGLGVKAELK